MTHIPDESLARLEYWFGRVLVTGVIISASLLALGLALWTVGINNAWERHILDAGLVTLMATPIVRVIVAAIEYTRRRDWFFAATSLAVLGVLALTIGIAFLSR